MLKAYKTEINPTVIQKQKINQEIGVCRYLYNSYLAKNQELYRQYKDGLIDKKQSFMSANDFDKYINHNVKTLEEYIWINSCGAKARKKAICNAETAYKRFFKGESKFPRFKKKKNQDVKIYFPKNNKGDWKVYRHKLMIPSLKNVRLKEFGYLPVGANVISGTVSKKADRYYVSVLIETEEKYQVNSNEGIGIDLGLKDFAIMSNGTTKKNINKTKKVKRLEKKLKREQRKLSRKYESLKLRNKNIKKEGGTATRQNIQKQIAKVQRLHQTLSNIRENIVGENVQAEEVCAEEIDTETNNKKEYKHLDVKPLAQSDVANLGKNLDVLLRRVLGAISIGMYNDIYAQRFNFAGGSGKN